MQYKAFAFLLALMWPPFAGLAQSSKNRSVLYAEQQRFEAMVRRDTVALSKWLSDELIYRHSNGLFEDKQAHLTAIASGALIYEHIARDSVQVRCHGRTALVNGVAHVRGRLNERPFEVRLAYLAVYRKKGARWQLTRWQSTRLP